MNTNRIVIGVTAVAAVGMVVAQNPVKKLRNKKLDWDLYKATALLNDTQRVNAYIQNGRICAYRKNTW